MSKSSIKNAAIKEAKIEETLSNFAYLEESLLLESLKTSKEGLSNEESEERLDDYGKNIIVSKKKKNKFFRFIDSIIIPFNLILIVIAIITLFTDVI